MELLVIGFDGLSYNMLEEFGVDVPFLRSVRNSGISGDLWSVDTPTTLPAWTSFATGKDPGSHGLSTMLTQSADYDITPAVPNTKDPAIYDLLENALFVNLPASTGRVPAADGTQLVSSFLAESRANAVPEGLQSLEAYDDYVVHADETLKSDPEMYFEHLVETTEARHALAREAFEREEPRVGFVLFSTPDWVGHHLQFAAGQSTRRRWYRSVVEACDSAAAELAQLTDNVLLLSDHGFEYKPHAIHLQSWLQRQGYLRQTENTSLTTRAVTGLARQVAKRFNTLFDMLRTAYLRVTSTAGGERLGEAVDFNPEVDYAASQAWQLRYGCVYVNDDRFTSPVVEDSAETVRALREELSELTDADGNHVFRSVQTPDEVYNDPSGTDSLPDLIARPASGYLPLRAFSPTGEPVIEMPGHEHYDHRYRGLIAADGPLFESGQVEDMSIIDVLPTLLHALDEPVSANFDGEVRTDFLSDKGPVTVIEQSQLPTPYIAEEHVASDEVVNERLRNLGYMN